MKKISLRIPHSCVEEIENFLEEKEVQSFSVFECAENGFSEEVDESGFPIASFFMVEIFDQTEEFLQLLNDKFSEEIKGSQISEIDNEDWVNQYITELKPIVVGGFYIYNGDYGRESNEKGLIPVKINSALAFGSGDHQTTKACISMLQYLKSFDFTPKNVLDMGCGSGILAICASKIWPSLNIIAIDIDDDAVQIAKDNFQKNEVVGEAFQGYDVSCYGKRESVDLIICNILKRPLEELSNSFFEILNPGGMVITSGFIFNQCVEIEKCYTNQGFEKFHQIQIDDWFSILFKKP